MRFIFFEKPDPEELRRRTAGWRQVWVWLPVLFAVGAIMLESTDTFSAEHTSGWLRPLIERLTGHIDDTAWDLAHHVFRKTGHFLGYGTVCLTWLRAWMMRLGTRSGMDVPEWQWKSSALAVLSTFAVANLDEWHQTLIPSRTGLFSDVVLDTVGAAAMCGVVWVLFWRGGRVRSVG